MNRSLFRSALALALGASAAIVPSTAQAVTDDITPVSDGSSCIVVSSLSIDLESDDSIYSIDARGDLVDGPSVSQSDCAGENSTGPISRASVALGSKTFTSSARTFTKTDTNGTFNGQYTPSSGHTVAFGYSVAAPLRAITTGPATAKVSRTPAAGTCSYSKTQAISYGWHWSCSTPFAQSQALRGVWTFPIQVSGVNGTATIDWVFNYRVDNAPCVPGQPC